MSNAINWIWHNYFGVSIMRGVDVFFLSLMYLVMYSVLFEGLWPLFLCNGCIRFKKFLILTQFKNQDGRKLCRLLTTYLQVLEHADHADHAITIFVLVSNDTEQWQLMADWMIYFNPLELSKHPLDEER